MTLVKSSMSKAAVCNRPWMLPRSALLVLILGGGSSVGATCTADENGNCCFGGASQKVVDGGTFQSHGEHFRRGQEHVTYAVELKNSCDRNIEVRITHSCNFSPRPYRGQATVPPGGKTNKYSVMRPHCSFSFEEVSRSGV